jgi:hypothetical protein
VPDSLFALQEVGLFLKAVKVGVDGAHYYIAQSISGVIQASCVYFKPVARREHHRFRNISMG